MGADDRRARRVCRLAIVLVGTLSLAALVLTACRNDTRGAAAAASPEPAEPEYVHPAFTITRDALVELVAGEPEPVLRAVEADPTGFLSALVRVLELPEDRTILVDKRHPLPDGYVPSRIVDLDSRSELVLSRPGHRLSADATEALLAMSAAAATDGVTLVVSSAYRSYEYQAGVYARWVEQLGREQADRVSARPGTSQHQLGAAIDFGCICAEFAEQPAGVWLRENAFRFGFSLSYPYGYEEVTGYSHEPWHYRYVGREATALERGYFAGIQQWMLEFLDRRRDRLRQSLRDRPEDRP